MSNDGLFKVAVVGAIGLVCGKIYMLDQQRKKDREKINELISKLNLGIDNLDDVDDLLKKDVDDFIDKVTEKVNEKLDAATSEPLGSPASVPEEEVPVEPGFNDEEFESDINDGFGIPPVEPGFADKKENTDADK